MDLAKSTYLNNKILNHVLKNTSYTSPTTVYLALFTSDPTVAGSGTEVTGGSYARQAVTFSTASSSPSVPSSNTGAVTFTGLPAAAITHGAVYDASTSGNLLYFGDLSSVIITNTDSSITFDAGDITIGEQ